MIGLVCYKCIVVSTTTECNSVTGKPPTEGGGHVESIQLYIRNLKICDCKPVLLIGISNIFI